MQNAKALRRQQRVELHKILSDRVVHAADTIRIMTQAFVCRKKAPGTIHSHFCIIHEFIKQRGSSFNVSRRRNSQLRAEVSNAVRKTLSAEVD